MLIGASEIAGRGVRATDAAIGQLADLLFDDESWTVRWAVVDTGTWLPGRQVLIPPEAIGEIDPVAGEVSVAMSSERLRESPGIATDEPVSRQLEAELYDYYGWAPYWAGGPAAYGAAVAPPGGPLIPPGQVPGARQEEPPRREGDEHLRSAGEVTGYHIGATDGEIGHVEELLIERESWAVRYLVVDTRNWWPGRMVLVAPHWARSISWADREVHVDLRRRQIEESPEYDPSAPVERDYEERLHAHYGQPPYWTPR